MKEIIEILKPFWLGIVKYVGIVLGLLLFYFKAKQDGKNAAKQENTEEILKGMQESAKINNDIAGANDAEYKRLYKKWSR